MRFIGLNELHETNESLHPIVVNELNSDMTMKLHVGTSGYSYKEWKGIFYPEDLAREGNALVLLAPLPAVEINNTFYRLPQASMIENWKAQVPPEFSLFH